MFRRKKRAFKAVAVFMLVVFCTLGFVESLTRIPAQAESSDARKAYEEKLNAAKEQKKQLEEKKAEQESLIAEFKEEKENIEKYIIEIDSRQNEITQHISELKEEILKTEEELEYTRQALETAKLKEQKQYEVMKKRIAYIYENGETSYMEILLDSGSISDFLNEVEYVNDIADYDNSLLDRYKAAKREVEDREALLEASLEELEAMKSTEELELETINDLINLKGEEIERITTELGVVDEYLYNYMSEISNKEVEIDEIIAAEQKRIEEEERKRKEEEERRKKEEESKKAAQEEKKKSAYSGYDADAVNRIVQTDETRLDRMIWPLPGDHRTYSKFGPRIAPTAGASTYHAGWDIGGVYGAPIVAVLAGTVMSTDYNSAGGNVVNIEHQPGFRSIYCHCSEILVKPGQYVRQGQVIARVGNTGVSTSAHLHFGLKKKGSNGEFSYIDPEPYIGKLE